MIGLDPNSVEATAEGIDRALVRLGVVLEALRRRAGGLGAWWVGPDASADRTTTEWALRSLDQSLADLRSVAGELRRQSRQQRGASVGAGVLVAEHSAAGLAGALAGGRPAAVASSYEVSRRKITLDLRVSGEVMAGGGTVEFSLTERADGPVEVRMEAAPELVAQLGVGNSMYAALGGVGNTEIAFEFADSESAHAFLDGLPGALIPEASDAARTAGAAVIALPTVIAGGSGLAAVGASYVFGEILEESTEHGGSLETSSVGLGARAEAAFDPPSGFAGAQGDVTLDEVISFDASSGSLVRVITLDGSAGLELFGGDLAVGGQAELVLPLNRPETGPAVATATVTLSGSAGLALLAKLGFRDPVVGDLIDATEEASVHLVATLPTEPQLLADPLSLAALTADMIAEGDLTVSVESGTSRSLGLDTAVVDVSARDETMAAQLILRRAPGGAWQASIPNR